MRAGRPAPQLREELAVLRHRLLIDCVNHERRDLRMRKFLVNSYGESMATKLKFIRLKIEDELIQPVNNLAGIRDELKADIASEIVEWYLNQRKAGMYTYGTSPVRKAQIIRGSGSIRIRSNERNSRPKTINNR